MDIFRLLKEKFFFGLWNFFESFVVCTSFRTKLTWTCNLAKSNLLKMYENQIWCWIVDCSNFSFLFVIGFSWLHICNCVINCSCSNCLLSYLLWRLLMLGCRVVSLTTWLIMLLWQYAFPIHNWWQSSFCFRKPPKVFHVNLAVDYFYTRFGSVSLGLSAFDSHTKHQSIHVILEADVSAARTLTIINVLWFPYNILNY